MASEDADSITVGGKLILATADAHGLYERFGFEPIDGVRFMTRRRGPGLG